jgi:dihydropyrimidinase
MSFKVFMAYKKRGMKLEDDEMLQIMSLVAAHQGLLAAHAENGAIIDFLEDRFISQGKETPDYHAPSHPGLSEAEAIFRLLTLGKVAGCSIYIPHISAEESLEVVRMFKKWGEPDFYTETCPHYLILSDDVMTKRGSLAKMAPPVRKQSDRQALWQALQEGLIDVVGSDHAGHTVEANQPLEDKIFDAPNGIPGLDTLFKVVYEEGVNKGRLTLNRLVEVMCEKPARIFGLYPSKGTLVEGSDADMVVFDPSATSTINARNPLLNVDYSLYENRKCLGAPVLVMQRGRILMEGGKLIGKPGGGRFLPGKKMDKSRASLGNQFH